MTLDSVVEKLKQQERLGIELNPPATDLEILQLEQAFGRALPPDLAAFYRRCNGFETHDLLFKINSIEWILAFSDRITELRFEVADYMISSDVWEVVLDPVDPTRYRILNSNHGSDVEVTLTKSLFEFISFYLDAEHGVYNLYEWYEAKKLKQ